MTMYDCTSCVVGTTNKSVCLASKELLVWLLEVASPSLSDVQGGREDFHAAVVPQ